MITVTLPWPAPELSPNARVHWRKKHTAAVLAKNVAFVETYPLKSRDMSRDTLAVTLTFHMPDRRKRDIDNLIASCKNFCDGICLGLNIDDSQFVSVTGQWGEVRKGGAVEIRLEAL